MLSRCQLIRNNTSCTLIEKLSKTSLTNISLNPSFHIFRFFSYCFVQSLSLLSFQLLFFCTCLLLYLTSLFADVLIYFSWLFLPLFIYLIAIFYLLSWFVKTRKSVFEKISSSVNIVPPCGRTIVSSL